MVKTSKIVLGEVLILTMGDPSR